jgi:hypothetical protein
VMVTLDDIKTKLLLRIYVHTHKTLCGSAVYVHTQNSMHAIAGRSYSSAKPWRPDNKRA